MSQTDAHSDIDLDPVTFEVLRSSFTNLVDRMAEQIQRTCYSFVIYNRDFSNCLNDAEGNTVMQGSQDIAVHVGTLHYTCKETLEYFEGNINPGDVYIVNDPYLGATHINDVRIMRPVFYDDELIAVTQSNGHWADVGGPSPGSFNIEANSHFAEGLRIPPLKIWDRGEFQDDVANLLVTNMRLSEDRMGDLRAQTEATRIAEERLLELVDKYGIDTVKTAFDESKDYVERIMRERIRDLPDGTWRTQDYIDGDPAKEEGFVTIDVEMTIDDDEVHYDLSGSDEYIGNFLNSTYGTSFSAVIAGTKMFFPDVPLNSGMYRVVDATLPEGTVVNAPEPVPVTGSVAGAYEKVMNAIFEMWSEVLPERAMACAFNLEYLLSGGTDRRPDRDGEEFMWYDWMAGGWGGRDGLDGANATAPVFGAGLAVQSLEGQERDTPLLTSRHSIVTDSAGPGEFRGGCGVEKGGRLLECENSVISYCSDRAYSVTWGLDGGLPGVPHGVTLTRADGDPKDLGTVFSNRPIETGDQFTRPSSGGGGFGDPLERDPDAVREDVIDDYVSIERAAKDYGVVIDAIDPDLCEYEIDYEATAAKRDHIREHREGWLEEDPESVAERYRAGELDQLDLVRQYGVILEWETGELLERTTAQFREMLERRAVAEWR
ncbi:hydantoinase B/oxoprolinase family protein [Natronorubrum bangense]|uniref:5-oxoprolinase n=2 Tax=Natronorubrum bangense TaxID=61858 RepID=L9W1G0_9EURY|nr:hydantoinase B/oxoprolinase family protein [Natronorubrum bangense]ELY43300.1 5-oxoprolinase [Natronorubrum bangense JCM 10635]QCC57083.1 hydantoinase B/oxoprolinase family protein [Natronorubrum bangense]